MFLRGIPRNSRYATALGRARPGLRGRQRRRSCRKILIIRKSPAPRSTARRRGSRRRGIQPRWKSPSRPASPATSSSRSKRPDSRSPADRQPSPGASRRPGLRRWSNSAPEGDLVWASPSSPGWRCCTSAAASLAGSHASSSSSSSASSSQDADEREPRRQPPAGLVALRDEQRKGPFWGGELVLRRDSGDAPIAGVAQGGDALKMSHGGGRGRNSVMARNRVAQRCYYPCLTLPRSPGAASL